ncbi:MAG: hypothetical protein P8X42_13600 [Calditrichaceae bacterium]|jgi:hypothetical protein
MRKKTIQDNLKTIYDFGSFFLVECPKCSKCAKVIVSGLKDDKREFKLVCEACGHNKSETLSVYTGYLFSANSKNYKDKQIGIGSAVDWYFHLPLWLSIKCKGHTLWVYNPEHLKFIENHVSSKIRGQNRTDSGWRNAALSSRLPKWMQEAGNREAILKCIDKLNEKLSDCR